jgi:hypothetical protein
MRIPSNLGLLLRCGLVCQTNVQRKKKDKAFAIAPHCQKVCVTIDNNEATFLSCYKKVTVVKKQGLCFPSKKSFSLPTNLLFQENPDEEF